MLHRASQFAAIILIVAMAASPLMACMVSPRQMTAEEQACCKKMAHSCESAVMPNSHSCCQHPVSGHTANLSSIRTVDLQFSPTALVETHFTPAVPLTRGTLNQFESPPESPLK